MKLINIDVEDLPPGLHGPGAGEVWALVRLHGTPIGMLRLPGSRSWASSDLRRLIQDEMWSGIVQHLVTDGLVSGEAGSFDERHSIPRHCPQRDHEGPLPLVTVAVCTRGRPHLLGGCLDSLEALDYPADRLEIVVVDNAPADDATGTLVRARARVRYVREDRPGLDFARNAAITHARGEIVAFTDDDARADSGWVRALVRTFAEEPEAMCVTGLVVPDALDTEAQLLFERYGGFGRGFKRIYARAEAGGLTAATHGGTGKFGTGANMAFRRSLFDRIGLFDPALDVGTPTNGGGDLEMFFRTIKEGHLLVYEPPAIVRHQHRPSLDGLRTQLTNNGIGFYSYLVRSAQHYRDERGAIVRLGLWWLWYWNLRRLLISFVRPSAFPRALILAELRGSIAGLWRYGRSRRALAPLIDAAGAPAAGPGRVSR